LFNDSTFSVIKIRQTCNGKSKEYFAHKAVLCGRSEWFMKAFTGPFKEATENVIAVHNDNPKYFEIMLKYIYTNKYEL
ncbi:hypothetical protein EK21DRAFT_26386, partial [Setomelanomma holmii]